MNIDLRDKTESTKTIDTMKEETIITINKEGEVAISSEEAAEATTEAATTEAATMKEEAITVARTEPEATDKNAMSVNFSRTPTKY